MTRSALRSSGKRTSSIGRGRGKLPSSSEKSATGAIFTISSPKFVDGGVKPGHDGLSALVSGRVGTRVTHDTCSMPLLRRARRRYRLLRGAQGLREVVGDVAGLLEAD